MRRLFPACAALVLALCLSLPAAAFETRARSAFIIDQTTGTVLLSKNADEALPPASMSKLMTLYVAFEAIRDGRLSLDETLPVSKHAMSYGGSTMFLDTTDRVRVEDLLRGIIVLSGNDACAVIAEALSPDGTEPGFARYMTQRAQQMGMTSSTFTNSNGWPQAGHRMSMRDLALLSHRLIADFPNFYPLFSEREFLFDGRAPQNVANRNPLLALGIGADGLKTGHTSEAGYGLAGSATQRGRRIIFVISGLETAQARAEEAEAIVNWAFRQFAVKPVAKAGTAVASAEVWMGRDQNVPLVSQDDVSILMPLATQGAVKAEVIYNGPITAPIAKDQQIAELVITPPGLPATRIPLVAGTAVPVGGFLSRVGTVAQILLAQLTAPPAAPDAELGS